MKQVNVVVIFKCEMCITELVTIYDNKSIYTFLYPISFYKQNLKMSVTAVL